MPLWRNGRRDRLKICYSSEYGGSSPSRGTANMTFYILCEESALKNKWITKQRPYELIESIRNHFNLSYLTASILASRNIAFEEIENFLNPLIKNAWVDPTLLPNLTQALEKLQDTVKKKGSVGILGDYDVDGISSSVLWNDLLTHLGVTTHIWLPNRLAGYGPNDEALAFFLEKDVDTLILVDCGSSAHEFLEKYSQTTNKKAIIIDHHTASQELPMHILINPHLKHLNAIEQEELRNLCATALSFLVAHQLLKKLQIEDDTKQKLLNNMLDLVALASVCDVMELNKLNRALIAKGLKILEQQARPGIRALIQKSQIKFPLTTQDIGFYLGPRLNAAGRMKDAFIAFELLSTKDEPKCIELANMLEKLNAERKIIQEIAFAQACIEAQNCTEPILMLASTNWHAGIIGIIAAMLQEKFHKPTIIGAIQGDNIKASARSHAIHIGHLIQKAALQGVITSGGGHARAGGLTCTLEQWKSFKTWYPEHIEEHPKEPITVDAIITLDQIEPDFHKLAPHGPKNEEAIIYTKEMRIKKIIKTDKYVRVTMEQNYKDYTFFIQNRNAELIDAICKAHEERKMINMILKLGNNIQDITY